jgi:DNA-binding NtrC family response regulator
VCKVKTGVRIGLRQVLLIDDNPLQLTVREAILRDAGFQVSVATSAESALATLRGLPDRVGVVVTDHIMPGCSGSELVQQIRQLNTWLPIIVLSGMPDAETEYQGLDVVFRSKPFPPSDMIELVKSSLEHTERMQGAA